MKSDTTIKKKNAAKTRALASHRVNGLLPKQARFVVEYLISGNAILVAKEKSEISQRHKERLDAMELTEARVNRETARIAFFEPRKLFDPDGSPKQVTDLDDDTAAAISGIDVLK